MVLNVYGDEHLPDGHVEFALFPEDEEPALTIRLTG